MEKTDLSKLYKEYFTARALPQLVDIEAAHFISITGKGDPSGEAFAASIQALYTAAYGIKFSYKDLGKDFVVSKLEGLWQFDAEKYKGIGMSEAPAKIPRSEWEYRLLIRMPDFVERKIVEKAIPGIADKKELADVKKVEWFDMNEGKCIQLLHVGPYSTEPESLAKIAAFSAEHGLQQNGLHHEIYLSDFRKTAPEKLKTILREPVK
ncbi:MAG: GyrI-like domain-containing protein [Chitinophagaceae bacterium]|nr:GyrI-like domain-containing protein [Chitinophagaceae bacterium]